MSHLWKRDADGAWAVIPLAHSHYLLSQDVTVVQDGDPQAALAPVPRLLRVPGPERNPCWALLAPASAQIAVNDQALALGLRMLRDRDKIRSGANWCYYFSTEQIATPEAFPGLDRTITCPRCLREIKTGDRAVCCPSCGTWHHSSDEWPCWTFAPTCRNCDQRTDAADSFNWSPALL